MDAWLNEMLTNVQIFVVVVFSFLWILMSVGAIITFRTFNAEAILKCGGSLATTAAILIGIAEFVKQL